LNQKKKRIKVLHVVARIYPFAGMEQKVIQLLNQLDRKVYKPYLLSLTDIWGDPNDYLKKDIQLYALNKQEGIQFHLVCELAKILMNNGIQIIHSHNWATLFHSVAAAKLARVPVVIHGEHGRDTANLDLSFKKKIVRRILYEQVDQFVAVAKDLKHIVIKDFRARSPKVRLILNGVELKKFTQSADLVDIKKKFRINKDEIVIATVAKLRPVKDIQTLINAFNIIQTLINAFNIIRDQKINSKLLIAGSFGEDNNSYQSEIQQLVKKLNLQNHIVFLGELSDIPQFLSVVDVYVNSSLSEGMSNTILEAMASGIPVVASEVGGNPELVRDGVNGFLFEARNEKECAFKILKILDDETLRKKMQTNAVRIIQKHHNLGNMIRDNQRMYQELMNKFYYNDIS
jgi:sugar transferase (PEP-CTERM/EpsH1 system associated)